MKLIKMSKPQVNEAKEVPGLLNCRIEYEVKSAKGRLEYTGPKFTPELWHQVLSFFRWTHKEMDSESQVRLYVNEKLGRWGAWAFPQVARTGMSAREVPTPEPPEKARERFAFWQSEPSDDWLYFGTVHHHCAASAFQSSTDEQNEWNQDGLHLTVGKLEAEHHEVHARFYLDGNCYEPDLSRFWAIDLGLAMLLPATVHHEVAQHQMGEKVTVDFPDAWRTNIVDVVSERMPVPSRRDWSMEQPDWGMSRLGRVDEALEEIHRTCAANTIAQEQWIEGLNVMAADEAMQIIIEACLRYGVGPEELLAEMAQAELGL